MIHLCILGRPSAQPVPSPPRTKQRRLYPPLHPRSLPRFIRLPKQLAPVVAARLPRPEQLFEFRARDGVDGVIRREEGALDEAAEEGDVRRADVFADRVEEVERRQEVLRRALWRAGGRAAGSFFYFPGYFRVGEVSNGGVV